MALSRATDNPELQETKSKTAGFSFKDASDLLQKIVCIFDDLPFLLKSLLPVALASIGTILLIGAGYLVFSLELYHSIQSLRDAFKKEPSATRSMQIKTNLLKIGLAIGGLVATSGLLACYLLALPLYVGICSALIPISTGVICGVELFQKAHHFHQAKQIYAKASISDDEAKRKKFLAGERKVAFGTIYFAIALTVASLAVVSTLAALSILSCGVLPVTAALVGVVCVSAGLKVFEMIDKKKDYKFTNAIRNFFVPPVLQDKPSKIMQDKIEKQQEVKITLGHSPENKSKSLYIPHIDVGVRHMTKKLDCGKTQKLTTPKQNIKSSTSPSSTPPLYTSLHDHPATTFYRGTADSPTVHRNYDNIPNLEEFFLSAARA